MSRVPFLSASYSSFRNIADGAIDLSAPEVFLVGENGQGKSNILESLYMSAYGASFRTRNDAEIARFGSNEFSVRAAFRDGRGKSSSFAYIYSGKRKRIERNSKLVADRKELVSSIPCILFSHDDMDFIAGSPERKRFFVDQSLSMHDGEYIDILRKYKKILRARNAALKEREISAATLDILDIQLAESGLAVMRKRRGAVSGFNQIFSGVYEEVSGVKGLSIGYAPSWKEDTADGVAAHLASRRGMEAAAATSLSGPHRDRILFVKGGADFAATASMGQKRLIALLLRVSQAVICARQAGKLPVLLMDDALLELDPDKRRRFTAVLPDYDQLFCAFLPGEPYGVYKRSGTMIYEIREGSCREAKD